MQPAQRCSSVPPAPAGSNPVAAPAASRGPAAGAPNPEQTEERVGTQGPGNKPREHTCVSLSYLSGLLKSLSIRGEVFATVVVIEPASSGEWRKKNALPTHHSCNVRLSSSLVPMRSPFCTRVGSAVALRRALSQAVAHFSDKAWLYHTGPKEERDAQTAAHSAQPKRKQRIFCNK